MSKVNNTAANNKDFVLEAKGDYVDIYKYKNWWVIENKQWTHLETDVLIPLAGGKMQMEVVKDRHGATFVVRNYYADTYPFTLVERTAASIENTELKEHKKLERLRSARGGG